MWRAICKAAARVGSDPMPRLQHISVMYRLAARRCLGIFPQLFPRKTGSLVVETPRLPGRSAVSYGLTAVLARNQADGVSASPRSRTKRPGRVGPPPLVLLSYLLLLLFWPVLRHQFENRDVRSSATSSSASSATMPTNARPGLAVVAVPGLGLDFAVPLLANYQASAHRP